MYICMCVYRNVFTPNLKLKQVTKKLKRGERCGWKKPGREKYLTKASPVKRERERKKKKIVREAADGQQASGTNQRQVEFS